ncbi:hypothetical protein BOCO_0396 [Bombiscardovia coagulans]|uniref:Uncharacterized protein n=2 Tax=Bombiscardovia coagulans TaxID=686666 RepID=A0A261ESP5_9BIFI|nr:hypothetical protein BOCO_0396 [Bombiscardovia coagulans]
MKLIKKVNYIDDKYCSVYECDKCHAYLFDKILLSRGDLNEEVCEPECAFCNANALLSQQYWMALCTVAWTCQPNEKFVETAPAFPSFDNVLAYDGNIVGVLLKLDFRGRTVFAEASSVRTLTINTTEFKSILDDNGTDYNQRTLAQAVVDLCRHDLRERNNRNDAE